MTASTILSSGAATTRAPDACSGPDEPEMLAVARHDLVLGPELEAGQDDVAAVGRRARQGDLLRIDGQERGQLRPDLVAQAERAGEVRLAAAALRQVDELLREDGLHGRPGERSVRAGVQVREVVEYRKGGACLVEGRRQGQG